VTYRKALNATTATNPANYTVSGGLTVTEADLGSDQKTVGLQLSGPINITSTTLTVNNVSDLSGNVIASNTTIAVSDAGFISSDVGDASQGVVVPFSTGDFTVLAGGRDIWGTDDSFNFVYKQRTG